MHENNAAIRNITVNVRKRLTTGHWGEKLAVYLHFPRAFPSLTCNSKVRFIRPLY